MNESEVFIAWRVATFGVLVSAAILILWMWIVFKRKVAALSAQSAEGPSEASLRDPVTGLYNRKHLLQRLQANMAQSDRKKERMAVILWDIDGFAAFNNEFGQTEGDRLLQRVAETIRASLRVYDEAFRAGSDEFCTILMPGDESVADEVCQRVSHTVGSKLFEKGEYADREFRLHYGVVYFPSDTKVPEALLHAARQALYKSRLDRAAQ